MSAEPRISPGTRAQVGWLNSLILAALARGAGTGRPPNLFATLARHRRLFRGWLWFAGSLMPGGSLPRIDTELVILRVAHNCRSEYEWRHHVRLGGLAGLSEEDITRIMDGPEAPGWSERQSLLLEAADQVHHLRVITDDTWRQLSEHLSQRELIELVMLAGHYEMLSMTLATLGVQEDPVPDGDGRATALTGRRVLITGAARGIGAATARRLHSRGARLVLAGIEPDQLAAVAEECGHALAVVCDVRDLGQVEAAVEAAVEELGGLDVVIANAGVAAQLPVLGGDAEIFDRTLDVNLRGTYYTLRSAAAHIAHPDGYALAISSLAAAVHPPLLGAYSASKAVVEALADAFRVELMSSGARVGVAYFAELDTDMTSRGFGTEAAGAINTGPRRIVTPLSAGVNAIERGVARRSRRVVAPGWVAAVLPIRMIAQRVVEAVSSRGLDRALEIARREHAPLTTALPHLAEAPSPDGGGQAPGVQSSLRDRDSGQ
ncbi:MAG TPA: SDR family NAD(P)-dependent oxidoreductase [Solirubrobacteraceae bacterium]|nr:SDR family NAD(P)-dependent oxidoreductase [Solirubrobacteraceae bacterium]